MGNGISQLAEVAEDQTHRVLCSPRAGHADTGGCAAFFAADISVRFITSAILKEARTVP